MKTGIYWANAELHTMSAITTLKGKPISKRKVTLMSGSKTKLDKKINEWNKKYGYKLVIKQRGFQPGVQWQWSRR